MTAPLDLDGVGQAELVRSGDVSASELVEASLARIDSLNPSLNAVIHRFDDRARVESAGPLAGPFAGVPMLIKDAVAHTRGDPYHVGMRFLKDRQWTEDHDTWLASRFRTAGFVFVGKSNTPKLAASATTEPIAYGPTRNPWDTARSTGGSSGGAAAAVASGMVAVAHGNDMGGSIRNPASQCGLVGLKPTRGRTTLGPDLGDFWGPLTHEGVLTRTVRDTAAVLDAIAGNAPGDPYLAPPLCRPLSEEVGADPGVLRIGFTTIVPGRGKEAEPDSAAAVHHTVGLLEDLGHHIEDSAPPTLAEFETTGGAYGITVCVAIARELDRWADRTGDPIGPGDVEPATWMMADVGRSVSGAAWLTLQEKLQRQVRELTAWWQPLEEAAVFDVLVMPTLGIVPPELGRMGPHADPSEEFSVMADVVSPLAPWNATGQPAISVPLHTSVAGLPVGVQLVAATGREDVLIRLASQLEAARPWSDRHPPPNLSSAPARDGAIR